MNPSGTQKPPSGSEREPRSEPEAADQRPGSEAVSAIFERMGILRQQAGLYLDLKRAHVKLSFRKAAIGAGLGLLGLIAAGALILVSVAFFIMGMAEGLRGLFGRHTWLGDLLAGMIVRWGMGSAVLIGVRKIKASAYREAAERYRGKQARLQRRLRGAKNVGQS